jgi:hypothetical protein
MPYSLVDFEGNIECSRIGYKRLKARLLGKMPGVMTEELELMKHLQRVWRVYERLRIR